MALDHIAGQIRTLATTARGVPTSVLSDVNGFDAVSLALAEARSRRGALATALGGISSLLGLAGFEEGKAKGGGGGGKGGGGKGGGKKGKGKNKKDKEKKPKCDDELNEVPCGQECCNSVRGTTCLRSPKGDRCCDGVNGVCCASDQKIACHKKTCIPKDSACCLYQGLYLMCAAGHTCGAPECPGVLAP